MVEEKRIYLSPPHMGLYELQFVQDAFQSNWIAPLGPHVEKFEQEMAAYLEVKCALAVNSGTSAIHLALRYIGINHGDLVFCSSFTFVASANPILYLGGMPVFIDSDHDSWNMSPVALERAFQYFDKLGKRPKAVIVVNLFGQSAKMEPIMELCDRFGVPVIEDAAESLGATYRGKPSGTFGKFGILSFNGNKMITTSGGGMIVSDEEEALNKIRFWSTQSRDAALHYQHSELGYNYRLSNILAAIGRGQLRVLDQRVESRREVFERYQSALMNIPGIRFMPEMEGAKSSRWLTTLIINREKTNVTPQEIIQYLGEFNIEARMLWKPLHLQPLFRGTQYFPYSPGESVSEQLFAEGLCLPSGSNLQKEEQERVIHCIHTLLQNK